MFKIFFLLISLYLFSFAKEKLQDENIQILAQNLQIINNIVTASGDVVVYSSNYYITANRLVYNKNNSQLELFDNVNVIKNNDFLSSSEYVIIDVKKDSNHFNPMLLLDNTNKIWVSAKNALKESDTFQIKDSILSSCDCIDPSWSIGFSHGDYNTTKEWINTYNATLYIKDFPILYTPYFGFSTNKTRRTGLLRPSVGYSKTEGFLYAQPFYYAPKDNIDFEYIPQYRVKRGSGHALKFRYVDSLYSSINFEAGVFNEKLDYQKENDLTNEKHHGWDFEYKRSKLFSTGDSSDGLLIESVDMNDVDYINTKYDTTITNNTDKYLESQFQYYYNTNDFYTNLEINYYNDISKDNNDETLQEIPAVGFHKYLDAFFNNQLTASIDINSNRQTRDIGVGGKTTEIYIPLKYHTYLFDDYLNFSFLEEINYTNINYTNTDYENAHYGENNHLFSFYTDLIKPYKNYIHSLNLYTTYTDSNTFKKSGDIYDSSNNDLDSFEITQTQNSILVGMEQSLYSKNTLQEIVNHKINQSYSYSEDSNDYKKDILENDLTFNFNYGSLSNRLIYDFSIKDFTTNSTTLEFKKDEYFANVYYTHSITVEDKEIEDEDKTVTYNIGFDFSKYYSIEYEEEYDLISKDSKKIEYVFSIDEKCWAIDFKFIDTLVASDTTDTDDFTRQKILYLEFNLKELFQIEQKYKYKESS